MNRYLLNQGLKDKGWYPVDNWAILSVNSPLTTERAICIVECKNRSKIGIIGNNHNIQKLNCSSNILVISGCKIEEERLFELSKMELPIMESIKGLGFAIPIYYDYSPILKRKKMKVNKRFEGRTIFKKSNIIKFNKNIRNDKHNIGKVF